MEQERKGMRGDPEKEAKAWADKLVEVDRMRSGYQELAAKGLMTFDELGERLSRLEEDHRAAYVGLEATRRRRETLEALERDRNALLDNYTVAVPKALDALSPEERHQVYRMLRLEATTNPADGSIEVVGVLAETLGAIDTKAAVSEIETRRSTCVTVDRQPENRLTVLATTSRVKVKAEAC